MNSAILHIFLLVLQILVLKLADICNVPVLAATLIIITIDTFLLGMFFSRRKEFKTEYTIIFIAYLVKLLIMFFDIYGNNIFMLPNSGLDSVGFYKCAVSASCKTSGYPAFLKLLYLLFGPSRVFFQYFNVLCSVFSEIILLKILKKLNISRKSSIITICFMCFLPNTIIISSILLRESLMAFLNTVSLYFFVDYIKEKKFKSFLSSVIFIVISAYFHSSVIILALIYSIIYILLKDDKFVINKTSVFKLIVVSLVIAITCTLFGKYIFSYFGGLTDMEKITKKMTNYSVGGSAYLQSIANTNNIWVIILTSPIKMIYFYISPMPWSWRGLTDIMSFMLCSTFYGYVSYKSLIQKNKNIIEKIIVLLIITIGLMYGLSCFNSGTAIRHREKTLPFICVSLSLLLERKTNYKKNYNILDNIMKK